MLEDGPGIFAQTIFSRSRTVSDQCNIMISKFVTGIRVDMSVAVSQQVSNRLC